MQGTVQWVKARTTNRDASRGQLLIEVLIALALLGLISVVFIGAMYTSLHAARVTDERSVALTLAKSQIEFAKAMPYSDNDWQYTVTTADAGGAFLDGADPPDWWNPTNLDTPLPAPLAPEYEGFAVTVSSTKDDLDEDGTLDDKIRKLTAVVHNRAGEEVFRLENHEIPR